MIDWDNMKLSDMLYEAKDQLAYDGPLFGMLLKKAKALEDAGSKMVEAGKGMQEVIERALEEAIDEASHVGDDDNGNDIEWIEPDELRDAFSNNLEEVLAAIGGEDGGGPLSGDGGGSLGAPVAEPTVPCSAVSPAPSSQEDAATPGGAPPANPSQR